MRQSAADVQTTASLKADYDRHRRVGHAGAIQQASRLAAEVVGPDGTRHAKGTAVPQRAEGIEPPADGGPVVEGGTGVQLSH